MTASSHAAHTLDEPFTSDGDAEIAGEITRWESLASVALALGYFASFDLASPVNGPTEIFGQDSVYILNSLGRGATYPYNPHHHILYHVATEWLHRLFHHGPPSVESAYSFLRVFTALSGVAFLGTFLVLLREIGLSAPRRLTLLALAGFSMPVWFNFAAFETHGLPLWAFNVVLASIVRLARGRPFGAARAILLGGALTFAALGRVDDLRLVPLAALPLLSPALRGRRLVLASTLAVSITASALGTVALTHAYLGTPYVEVAAQLATRTENHHLQPRMRRIENFSHLRQMLRAATVYAVLMPEGPKTFESPLDKMVRRPLSTAALLAVLLLWARLAIPLVRGLAKGDVLLWSCTIGWVGSVLFFTWLNPFEPFLWLLELLPFFFAVVAHTLRRADGWTWRILAVTAALALLHNGTSFWMKYDYPRSSIRSIVERGPHHG